MGASTPVGPGSRDVGSDLPGPGWYPDPDLPAGERYWTGTAWGDRCSPRDAQQRHWRGAPSAARVLVGALMAQAAVLMLGGLYGLVVALDQPSTGSGLRELVVVARVVMLLMAAGCVAVAVGVRRRRSGAVGLAALMEIPAAIILPVALWRLAGQFTIQGVPLLVPLSLGIVALVAALHPRTTTWVRAG